jgi:XTP/dITP diphosphohydrolase
LGSGLSDTKKIVLASNNAGKVLEINVMLAGHDLQVISQSEFSVPEIEETGLTFVENALLKARHAAQHTGLPAIADDSGIEISALQGQPGIYSARYAGVGASDEDNLDKLISEIKKLPEDHRQARFVCLMVFLRHAEDPVPLIAEGIWDGIAVTVPKGHNGFGYDPMFYVPTHNCTSAELPSAIKNRISHRGQALQKLVAQLNTCKPG